jgi:hypothetical protein
MVRQSCIARIAHLHLFDRGFDNSGVRMALVHGRVSAQKIVILLALGVPHVHALLNASRDSCC